MPVEERVMSPSAQIHPARIWGVQTQLHATSTRMLLWTTATVPFPQTLTIAGDIAKSATIATEFVTAHPSSTVVASVRVMGLRAAIAVYLPKELFSIVTACA